MRLDGFARVLSAAGERVDRAALERGYDASAEYLGDVWRALRDVPVASHVDAILAAVNRGLPARLAPDVKARLVDAYAGPALLVPPAVDDGALGALMRLRDAGYTLAVVSNAMRTPGATLRQILEHYGLLRCFAHTTFSDEVGVRKPAAEIFALTLRAVGGEPATAVHVGDDPVLDVQGARAAGMRVIQVAAAPSTGAVPDAVIGRLAGLPEAVARLERA
ncbi:MAG: HAD-IA family hydrolase [Candidatus Rokubacteria bacterium]|nr:HAD-IA family hydrolase [Candidatus Rokubacteria bacterium]MBI3825805.1 HAD-IA family hydrolase [Candidatus Rokubacteria bacterium]